MEEVSEKYCKRYNKYIKDNIAKKCDIVYRMNTGCHDCTFLSYRNRKFDLENINHWFPSQKI